MSGVSRAGAPAVHSLPATTRADVAAKPAATQAPAQARPTGAKDGFDTGLSGLDSFIQKDLSPIIDNILNNKKLAPQQKGELISQMLKDIAGAKIAPSEKKAIMNAVLDKAGAKLFPGGDLARVKNAMIPESIRNAGEPQGNVNGAQNQGMRRTKLQMALGLS